MDEEQKVRIIKAPDHEAPLKMRQAWVGLELPAKIDEATTGVLLGRADDLRFIVPMDVALQALKRQSLAAYFWYLEELPTTYGLVALRPEEVEIVDPDVCDLVR